MGTRLSGDLDASWTPLLLQRTPLRFLFYLLSSNADVTVLNIMLPMIGKLFALPAQKAQPFFAIWEKIINYGLRLLAAPWTIYSCPIVTATTESYMTQVRWRQWREEKVRTTIRPHLYDATLLGAIVPDLLVSVSISLNWLVVFSHPYRIPPWRTLRNVSLHDWTLTDCCMLHLHRQVCVAWIFSGSLHYLTDFNDSLVD